MVEHESAQHDLDRSTDLVPADAVRRLTEAHRVESELGLVTTRLDEIPELKRDPGARVSDHVEDLRNRRDGLLTQPRRNYGPLNNVGSRPVDSLVSNLGHFFTSWKTVNLPYFAEGVDETPGVAGTTGDIETKDLYPGGLGYGGHPSDAGSTQPNVEKWWVHNWTCSYVFPPAPFGGKLYYRFTVDTTGLIYNALAQSGLINAFVTIGQTSDVLTGSPFDDGAWDTVGWPVWVTLPQTKLLLIDDVSVPVAGSIDIQAGKRAALGFIYGAIVGIASGFVNFSWASMGTRLTLPPGTSYDGQVFDKIEYRFEPDWW